MAAAKKPRRASAPGRLREPAMGLEAEFSLVLDDQPVRPEDLFASPRDFIRGELVHREGRSYQLPGGSAVYFDTGVIEVATPVFELDRGCAARAGRSLWETIGVLRRDLDAWDARQGRRTRLVGFSAHYNVSFELPPGSANGRSIEQLALLLAYILPAPVMLLAANRRSTGVGVRPRQDRIEITCDFTPSAPLMTAAATVIVALVREVMAWPSYQPAEIPAHDIPILAGFHPVPHTSRQGWLAHATSYPHNPFSCDIDQAVWPTERHGTLSLRGVAARTLRHFWRPIVRYADPLALRRIGAVLRGRGRSLLDLDDRPPAYEDVGRRCAWDERAAPAPLARSRYERVVMRALSGRQLRMNGHELRPVGMRGWSAVVFRRDDDRHEVIAIDDLVPHLEAWEHGEGV